MTNATITMPTKKAYEYGELKKIAELSGFSYAYVRDVLVAGRRSNNVITSTSEIVRNSKRNIEQRVMKLKQKVA